jgi:3-isopropylmalate/(R)-2-methylmalate dehydratase small subunit
MEAVSVVSGTVCPLDRADVDTDQIIPKQFLKRVDRAGFGPFSFYDWRYGPDEEPVAEFPMNRPEHAGATILLTGPNFGCGSSREHAVWALQDAGFEAIIAPSFADIFKNNCAKVGVVTVELPAEEVQRLFALVDEDPSVEVTVDLIDQVVRAGDASIGFTINQTTRHRLLNGLDDIGITLGHADAIDHFEDARPDWLPSTTP